MLSKYTNKRRVTTHFVTKHVLFKFNLDIKNMKINGILELIKGFNSITKIRIDIDLELNF